MSDGGQPKVVSPASAAAALAPDRLNVTAAVLHLPQLPADLAHSEGGQLGVHFDGPAAQSSLELVQPPVNGRDAQANVPNVVGSTVADDSLELDLQQVDIG
jgi:hypothetical protein